MVMKFCSNCGQPLTYRKPPGDDRSRYICETCGVIHYQNPLMVVGCIPEKEDKILLCRRAIEPCYGQWTLPAGYLENGETVAAGAKREAYEEARARVEILAPYALYNICHVNQIYLMFRARLVDDNFRAGSESLVVRLFTEEDIPWDEIAFRVIKETLNQYYKDRQAGRFPFYVGDIAKSQ
ncbi:MAG: NUDIX hydrolase [Desulfobacterales bacterium]|nr:MAG: NUDIX hydrolase [Desulfobacterales bacterium]